MSNPYVRPIGRVEDHDGRTLVIGVDYDTITIGPYRLGAEQALQFLIHMNTAMLAAQANKPDDDE